MAKVITTLSRILGERRMSQTALARKAGLSSTTVNRLYNDTWKQLDRDTIESVCEALSVTPGDFLEYRRSDEVVARERETARYPTLKTSSQIPKAAESGPTKGSEDD